MTFLQVVSKLEEPEERDEFDMMCTDKDLNRSLSEKFGVDVKGATKKITAAGGSKAKKKRKMSWESGSESEGEEHYGMSDSDSDGSGGFDFDAAKAAADARATDKPKRKTATTKYNFGDDDSMEEEESDLFQEELVKKQPVEASKKGALKEEKGK